jgi:carbon storage regulator
LLKLSLKEGEYMTIGENIKVVYVGSNGKNGRFLIDAPRELNIARSKNEVSEETEKKTYYPDPEISAEAQKEIQRIIWKEKQKKTDKKQAD